jgi:hypothetical protein
MSDIIHKSKKFRIKNGFVFSIDALLAISIMLILLGLASFYSIRIYPETFPLANLQLKTNDILILLDKLGYFSRGDSQAISQFINKSLENGIEWHMTIEYYTSIINGTNVSFALNKTIDIGTNSTKFSNSVSATRIFTVINSTNVSYYGRVKLISWYKNS